MTAEASWAECATQVMEGKEEVWFTVQFIVAEIKEKNLKPSMLRLPPSEAARSLRSCLRHHARKDNGRFVRKQSSGLIQYALRKEVPFKKPQSKRPPHDNKSCQSNGDPLSPHTLLHPPPTISVIVEVDDPDHAKSNKSRQPRDSTPSMSRFLLPSPSLSLLAARKTLHVLCAGDTARPVRKTRGKGDGERTRDRSRPSDINDFTHRRPSVLSPEELCSVSTQSCDVAFLKSACEGSPTQVQGDRVRRMLCEVDPNKQLYSDSSTHSSDGSDMEYSSAASDEEHSTVSNYPSSCYHSDKSSLSSRKTASTVAITTNAAGRRSEIARQFSHLLSSSSPLVGENLKVLLGMSAFEGLSPAQKHQLTALLPNVDQAVNGRIQPLALSNAFFGSACREWQDHLALGLHGNTGGRGSRAEKKPRINDNSWKDKYFESKWGDRLAAVDEDEQMFFPSEPVGPLSQYLHAILDGYHSISSLISVPPTSTIATPPLSSSPLSSEDRKVLTKTKASSKVGGTRRSSKVSRPSRPGVKEKKERKPAVEPPSPEKNHVARPHPSPRSSLSRVVGRNHQMTAKKPRTAGKGGSMYLSPLPHKMSYSSIIEALHKASRPHKSLPHQTPHPCSTDPSSSPPTLHSHPVFLDHFSTLHAHSVPTEFLSSPPPSPPAALLVSLPRSLHAVAVGHRAALSDHNYTPIVSDPPPTLPLSVPRSLLPLPSPCLCSSHKFTLCSTCNSLYHVNCSHGNLCPTCTRKPALT